MRESLLCKKILERDLVMNIYQDGQWGSYRYLTAQGGDPKKKTEYAFLNVQTRGDLSTLQWFASPLSCTIPVSSTLCSVYYAPLNFHDVMLATGKIAPEALSGVDLVLNSLSEEKLQASLRCLASHGRFLEIGKFDLAKDSMLGMSVFLKRATFSGVHLETARGKCPSALEDQRRLKKLIQEGIVSGVVRPLDTIRFSREEAEEAFRFMASGKHIGKVVLEVRPEERARETALASPLEVEAVARTWFYEHKAYIVVGGLGGFGLELAEWMVSRGCRKLLLSSRSGVRTGYQKRCLQRWQQSGAEVISSRADASTEEGARQLIEEASAIGPIGGIFNLALASVKDPASLDANTSLGDLGMDSLIGVEVQQTLERRYDVTLSMAEIRKLTVNRLVAIQEGTGNTTSEAGNAARTGRRNAADPAFESKMPRLKLAEKLFPDRVLVEMNDLDGSTPLFMVHPVQGDVSVLFEIAAHIPVRTVGVQRTDEIPVRSIEEMAAIYLQRMLQVQPAGPYHLAGYSYGAAVVFEAAVQLQASGASVGSLTLLDGGPRYVAALWSHHKSRLEGSEHDAETSLICTFLMQYADIDVLEVN
ncbi:hypothetical protein V5799_026633 [Amblyomma americanum]|uniref:oleoyl-[acyl-carrier-protein] hydrolase n=1 Tax=Amblyomma americanum TaxID=6943 RepID=A0AAQ4DI11_AMBAM